MLQSLYVRNYALIEELSIEFREGLTTITGETGAGKSILMGALNLVLGGRSSTDMVRSGSTKAVIEALFTPPHPSSLPALLEEAGIAEEPELILRRDVSASGQSRSFINDTPCTATMLRRIGSLLVDLHGQHDHQQLLDTASHAPLLDGFGSLGAEKARYSETLQECRRLRRQIDERQESAALAAERREFLEFQYRELDTAGLSAGEEEELDAEITLLENAETLFALSGELAQALYEAEGSAFSQLSGAAHSLEKLAAIDPSFEAALDELRGAATTIEELSRHLGRYASGIEFNPSRLEEQRERHHFLQRLARKHGKSIGELIELHAELARQLAGESSREEEDARLEAELQEARRQLSRRAADLTAQRLLAARKLEAAIVSGLGELGIPTSTFTVGMERQADAEGDLTIEGVRYRALDEGAERIEFLMSTNAGEEPRPLARVASGGEISRVMLAMKSALASSTDLPILVFDEIDTGISGRVAEAVGRKLRQLSGLHQIIAITHLPQIAAMGSAHLVVRKAEEAGRTRTEVNALQANERIDAVAALISGNSLTPSSRALASELLAKGQDAER